MRRIRPPDIEQLGIPLRISRVDQKAAILLMDGQSSWLRSGRSATTARPRSAHFRSTEPFLISNALEPVSNSRVATT